MQIWWVPGPHLSPGGYSIRVEGTGFFSATANSSELFLLHGCPFFPPIPPSLFLSGKRKVKNDRALRPPLPPSPTDVTVSVLSPSPGEVRLFSLALPFSLMCVCVCVSVHVFPRLCVFVV